MISTLRVITGVLLVVSLLTSVSLILSSKNRDSDNSNPIEIRGNWKFRMCKFKFECLKGFDHNATIGIGLAITFRTKETSAPFRKYLGYGGTSNINLTEFPIFTDLLPSFCRTCSSEFVYHFYLAYDSDDPFFQENQSLLQFKTQFQETIKTHCEKGMNISFTLIKCNHTRKPAWAQNDAMMKAYNDNMAYLYRINDDTIFQTNQWTEKLINQLQRFSPPNIGVVGPYYNEGNTDILTYEFVHRTHVDIFGFYYPHAFIDWCADTWMTAVYYPGRVKKVKGVYIKHTQSMGTRYKNHKPDNVAMDLVIRETRKVLAKSIGSETIG